MAWVFSCCPPLVILQYTDFLAGWTWPLAGCALPKQRNGLFLSLCRLPSPPPRPSYVPPSITDSTGVLVRFSNWTRQRGTIAKNDL